MNTQRRFFSCMMIIGALQSFVFCSSALDTADNEIAGYVGYDVLRGRDLELDDIMVNASPVETSAFSAPRSCIYQVAAPENIKTQLRSSGNRKRYSIESRGAISQSVQNVVLTQPLVVKKTLMPVSGNRPRTHAIDMRGDVDVLLEADQDSRDEEK